MQSLGDIYLESGSKISRSCLPERDEVEDPLVVAELTRECLALDVGSRLDSSRVMDVLEPLFKEKGAPVFVRSDNGGEISSRLLAVLLAQSGSGSHFIEPWTPWQNGLVESSYSTLRRAGLGVDVFANPADGQIRLALYRRYYNEVRPHSSLGYAQPASAQQV